MKKSKAPKPVKVKKEKAPKTRNGGTFTESQFWGFMRSGFRRQFRFWVPIQNAKRSARREYVGENKRQKWEYLCNNCQIYFPDKNVEVDHVTPCGSLKEWEDILPFLKRLTAEGEDSYRVLCKECHNIKTQHEREERKNYDNGREKSLQ